MAARTQQSPAARWKAWLGLAIAVFLLNLSLTFHNVWPTLWVTTRHELSVEVGLLLLALVIYAEAFRPPPRRWILWLAPVLTLLALGRYAEVTAPALYGRPINLYWDAQHLPRVAAMLAHVAPVWLVTLVLLGAAVIVAGIYGVLRWSLRQTWLALSDQTQRRALGIVAAGLVGLFLAGQARPQIGTLSWFSLPVTITYAQQARFLSEALASAHTQPALPQGQLAPSDLARVAGVDVFVVFLESYGAAVFDRPTYAEALAERRVRFAAALDNSGRQAVSAYVESPTFGGASWLAHVSLLAGADVRDNRTYNLFLTQDRETLVHRFTRRGHRAVALMPGLRQNWPEGGFYGFMDIYGERLLDYRGPEFGWWRIPDQYALAKLDQLETAAAPRAPLFVFYPTISTHMPFRPTPPYQADWGRILSEQPFDSDATGLSLARKPDWTNLGPAYVESMAYALGYLAGYLEQRAPRDMVMVVLGDHQPAASVSGQGASWEVPVHVISNRKIILDSLVAHGFRPGLTPQRPKVGRMHELTDMLLRAFDSGASLAGLP